MYSQCQGDNGPTYSTKKEKLRHTENNGYADHQGGKPILAPQTNLPLTNLSTPAFDRVCLRGAKVGGEKKGKGGGGEK